MSRRGYTLRVRLYSEDLSDSKRKCQILEAMFGGMCKLVQENLKSHYVETLPVQNGQEPWVCGSRWKAGASAASGDAHARRSLIRQIATHLTNGRVVFFHVDGDTRWRQRRTAEVWRHLERFRTDVATAMQRGRAPRVFDDDHFIPAIPFVAMESWLFANVAVARERVASDAERARLDEWDADLSRLDEVPQDPGLSIKDLLPSLDTSDYLALASERYPAARLDAAGTSYKCTVDRLRQSNAVVQGLKAAAAREY